MHSTRKFSIGQAFIKFRSLDVFIIFILLYLTFFILSPAHRFVSKDNQQVFLAIGSEFNIIAVAVGMLMIAGEFDLSVGSILVFSSFTFLKLMYAGVNIYTAGIITLLVGSLIGLINGVITVKAGIPSFITTLGTMMLWRGVTLFWSEGLQKPLDLSKYSGFTSLLTGTVWNLIPAQFLWFLLITIVLLFIVHHHRFGNWIFTTGDNKQAARAMGINTDRVKIICFIIVGLVSSFVAIMQIVRVGTFTSRAGDGWGLNAVAASVVGGISLSGGVGSIFGVFWGSLIISIIQNGLVVMRIPYYWTFTIFGVILIGSVVISIFIEKKRLALESSEISSQ